MLEGGPGIAWEEAKRFWMVKTPNGRILYHGPVRADAESIADYYLERSHRKAFIASHR